MKLFSIAALLAVVVASVGCQATPVTFAPYAGYGGSADGFHRGDSDNYWQVGVGASFTLGGSKEYVTPVPGHPSLPVASQVHVNNSNTNSNSASQQQGQAQGQVQGQSQDVSVCGKCKKKHYGNCN